MLQRLVLLIYVQLSTQLVQMLVSLHHVEMVQTWRSTLSQTGDLESLSVDLSDVVQRVIDDSGLAVHYARGGTEEDHDRVENLDEAIKDYTGRLGFTVTKPPMDQPEIGLRRAVLFVPVVTAPGE